MDVIFICNLQIILEVAPDVLYDEIFVEVFKGSLFDLSCHSSGNFVVQALICHARSKTQVCSILFCCYTVIIIFFFLIHIFYSEIN